MEQWGLIRRQSAVWLAFTSMALCSCSIQFKITTGETDSTKIATAGPAAGLEVALDQWWVRPSTCSEPIRIRMIDASGNLTTSGTARTVNLTDRVQANDATNSATGSYYEDAGCAMSAVTSIAFAADETEKVLYYENSSNQTVRIEATATGLATASQMLTSGTEMSFSTANSQSVSSTVLSNGPYGIATGDFNKDGKPDVATSVYENSEIVILYGQEGGTLGSYGVTGEYLTLVPGSLPYGLEAAYLDGPADTTLDLVATNFGDDVITVHRNNGDGTFQAKLTLATTELERLRLDDLDGDDYTDIIAAKHSGGVDVYLNDQLGGFTGPSFYAAGTEANDVYTGDFNGDGFPEIVVPCADTNNLYVLVNDGTGGFGAANAVFDGVANTTSLVDHWAVTTGLFNSDGFLDLAYVGFSGGNKFAVSLGNGTGADLTAGTVDDFSQELASVSVGSSVFRPIALDADGDGDLDIATPSNGSNAIFILENDGNGIFTNFANYNGTGNPRDIATFDLNEDGQLDLVTADTSTDTISVFYGVP